MRSFRGITHVHASQSRLNLLPKMRMVQRYRRKVTLDQRNTGEGTVTRDKNVLSLDGVAGDLHLPAAVAVDIQAENSSVVEGRLSQGRLDADDTSIVQLAVPPSFDRSHGEAARLLRALILDIAYMAAVALVVVAAVNALGYNAAKMLDWCALIGASVYVGINPSPRSLATSATAAGLITVAPEVSLMIGDLGAGISALGGEDLAKALTYIVFWGGGKLVRNRYDKLTA